ncbi:MAG: 2-isopropylmalate synthase [Nitrospira sp.]|nr:2-isopropylmalate synthase [Candidatus Manganitrophaceae bacterium]HIL34885.1 2-isopropylmalate synthase [Candidatus Manganitrophaceae bacterium]
MSRLIRIFDTTLRDGEQSPGATMNVEEKVFIAKQLARLGVDVIEAGFAFSSPGDFEAIQKISQEMEGPVVCSLARAKTADVDSAWEALRGGAKVRIHTFISTSDIHLKYQFRMTRKEALDRAVEIVQHARGYVDDVEFSPMDATRSEESYLCEMLEAVIAAGAKTVNIPDTVGYTTPEEFHRLIQEIRRRVPNIDQAVISVHCHNDLGLAVSNSLSAIHAGAGQVECTINGIGERAGNASLEEVVMALRTRQDFFEADTQITTEEIMTTSRLVSRITRMPVQPNKAIVGDNAFAHESGIHQDGLLKEKMTYEIIRPESVGVGKTRIVLGKHSGRHAFKNRLEELGYHPNAPDLDKAFERMKNLADQKKEIFDEDLEAIISEEMGRKVERYHLISLHAESGSNISPTATIELAVGDRVLKKVEQGDGVVDAAYKTIASMTETKSHLKSYIVKGITGGTDALGEVTVILEEGEKRVMGHGADTDIIIASVRAYLNALNKLAAWEDRRDKGTKEVGLI